MSSNLNRRRIALMASSSTTLEDFINKKLGVNKDNQRPVLIKKNTQNENTTN